MLTNLNFLNVGQVFPPASEIERINEYYDNIKLYDGKHTEREDFRQNFDKVKRVKGDFVDVLSYEMILDFPKLITNKIVDLLFGETPGITILNKDKQDGVNKVIKRNSLFDGIGNMVAKDVSRFGYGLFKVYKESNKAVIDTIQPYTYYKVVNPRNIRQTVCHVVCIKENEKNNEYDLYTEIHYKGYYVTKTLRVKNGVISKVIKDEEIIKVYKNPSNTNPIDDFGIIDVQKDLTSDKIYGCSDYTPSIVSLLKELECRFAQLCKILDKHSEPSIMGPKSALEKNPDGSLFFRTGNYFIVENGEKIEYVVWDAKLDFVFTEIKMLCNFIYMFCELGGTLLGDKDATENGSAISGTAYKYKMENAIMKVKRMANAFDLPLKRVIKYACALEYIDIDIDEISIVWKDGLDKDEKVEAETMNIKNGGKPTISHKTSIKIANNMSDEEAEAELAQIQKENTK